MFRSTFITGILLFSTLCFTASAFAEEDVTMHQVYLTAEAGKFNEAQAMMDKVLRDHPNSAKAHFVEAELLAKQGLLSKASAELNTAERLQPGLPFVKPDILQKLKIRITSSSNEVIQPNISHQNRPSDIKNWMPIALLVLGLILIILLIVFIRSRKSDMLSANNYAGKAPGANGTGFGMGQPPTGGMGSGIMSNLATGAALGAGVVAGEALMHHFIDNNSSPNNPPRNSDSTSNNMTQTDDMGGTDFGIADASSWDDDVASDGDDDWT